MEKWILKDQKYVERTAMKLIKAFNKKWNGTGVSGVALEYVRDKKDWRKNYHKFVLVFNGYSDHFPNLS